MPGAWAHPEDTGEPWPGALLSWDSQPRLGNRKANESWNPGGEPRAEEHTVGHPSQGGGIRESFLEEETSQSVLVF